MCSSDLADAVVGRLGGEEFAVALPGVDLEGARATAERIRAAVAAGPVETERGALGVTVSVGVAEAVAADALDDVLRRADDRLNGAKRDGRDRVVG